MTARTIGSWGCVALVLLRFAVGWHFYQEGRKKIVDPNFSSDSFLRQATGPLAKYYLRFCGDPWELDRLDLGHVTDSWREIRTAFDQQSAAPEVQRQVEETFNQWNERLLDYFQQRQPEIQEYLAKARAAEQSWQESHRSSPGFRKDWYQKRLSELGAWRAPWIADLRAMTEAYRDDLILAAKGSVKSPQVPNGCFAHQKTWIDHGVSWTVTLVGVGLLLGLFVPLASWVGIGFLLSVMASQPFWVSDANLLVAYYQFVEIASLAVLAAFSAGRYAGLDFLLMRRRQN